MPDKPTPEHPQHAIVQLPTTYLDVLKLFMQQYGSLAFGLISLVIIWLTMVVPQLDRNQVSAENQRLLLEELHRLIDDQKEVASHLKTTAEIFDRATLRTDRN
jgi:uncharacterized membrane-anchored protein YhcB (DUF1043 family)